MTPDLRQKYVEVRAELADPHMKLLVDGLAHDYAKSDPPRFAAHLASLRQAQKASEGQSVAPLRSTPCLNLGTRRV